MSDPLLKMLQSPVFDARIRHQLPLRDYMELTISRMRKIVQAGLITNDMWLGQARQSEFRLMIERTATVGAFDYALFAATVDHMIAGNALLAQGDALQVARYRQEIIEMSAVYAFGCTEINSGSDVRNLQTTVSYDRLNHCLILHTPSPAACKFWIGNALYAAQVVMVLARLMVDGEDEGLHWFRVRIRDKENGPLLPGVKVMACDPKGGIHANQVAGIRFNEMRLPLDAMMQRHARFSADGQFSSDVPRDQRVTCAMETFIQERLFLLAAARGGAGLCAHLAYRFVCHRQQKNATGYEPLLSKPLIRQRLYVEQLKALALKLLEQAILSRFETAWDQPDKRKELHILAAIAKSVGTWMGLEVMRMCRELCGSQGFHHYNQITTSGTDNDISITFAGDNSIISQWAQSRGSPRIVFQLLLYPLLDGLAKNPSHVEFAKGYGLTADMLEWYLELYVPQGVSRADPRLSPVRQQNLKGLPPALIITSELDVLRDEGREYVRRLTEADVPVLHKEYPGMLHGFINYPASFDEAKQALLLCAQTLQAHLHG